ncbi:hypothetical protein V1524DRAFT_412116 [Lipomyces starkeyi]
MDAKSEQQADNSVFVEEKANKVGSASGLGEKLKDSHDYDSRVERNLLWKLDLVVLPLLALVLFFSNMDRSDLGNTYAAGMAKLLHINSQQYSNITSFFLVGDIIFQPVGTLFILKLHPPLQFGLSMMLWGALTIT